MSRIAFPAMGTTVEAWVDDEASALVDWFEEVERVCSRFIETSELFAINQAVPGTMPISDLMQDVLQAALGVRSATSGLVDIGVGAAVADWGYDRTYADLRPLDAEPEAVPEPGWSLGRATVTVSSGTSLDLGGVAKGWTCDQAVEKGLAQLVSAGGDMRSNHPATIASVVNPWGEVVARLPLGTRALATSSVARRRWRVADREVSHLIDPTTMRPVDSPVLSATVVAGTAVEAEAGAKCVLLKGADGLYWADACPWVDGAIVVWHDGSVYGTKGLELVA